MKKVLAVLAMATFLSGCASMGYYPHNSVTQVNLEKNNYRMVAPNAQGASSGFKLLGFISLTTPQHTVAMNRLYKGANINSGGAFALTNVVEEQTASYFILFSIPTYRVRADVVEFVSEKE